MGTFLSFLGGINPTNIEKLRDPEGPFLTAFHDKGRVSNTLRNIPLFAVLADDLGKRGAYFIASRELLRK